MRPLWERPCIQIVITNKCNLRCASCSEMIGHRKEDYEMSLPQVREALESLAGYVGEVGIFGGEPTLHKQFKEICELLAIYVPFERRGLWTNGAKWEQYKDLIHQIFPEKNIVFNDHSEDDGCVHQPLLIASDEIIQDKNLMWRLINNCWLDRWSPAITNHGAFFCEIASALEDLFHLKKGWAVWAGWWKKDETQFKDQQRAYCKLCSACIPFPPLDSHGAFEYISPENLMKLMKNNVPNLSRFEVYTKQYTYENYNKYAPNWTPWKFRSFYSHGPGQKLERE